MPIPFIIPLLIGLGVGAAGTLAYMSNSKPKVSKKGDITYITPKKAPRRE